MQILWSRPPDKDDMSGKGAELAGGRWNSIGQAMFYTAENRALCTAEIAVHTPLGIVPKNYYLISIEIPQDTDMLEIDVKDLPKNWKTFPHSPITKKVCDQFIAQNNFLIMKVPSAVIHGAYNCLINPTHKNFKKVNIVGSEPFAFDKRLFDK
ncbi:MAG: RES family NAD+ phosphorylase [Saprospiraceae bacterium]|nr:RES family NAD+ phosphorylase [Saprospiraceae bacterium]